MPGSEPIVAFAVPALHARFLDPGTNPGKLSEKDICLLADSIMEILHHTVGLDSTVTDPGLHWVP